jgi:hypothetical protein
VAMKKNKYNENNEFATIMINLSNKDYLDLLLQIVLYFQNKGVNKDSFYFYDTVIRFDEESEEYVASIYTSDPDY